mgnify:CR=1 FL=1
MENYNLESARELINSAEKELSKEFEKEYVNLIVKKY